MYDKKKYIAVLLVALGIVGLAYLINILIDSATILKDTLFFGGILNMLTFASFMISGGGFTDTGFSNMTYGGRGGGRQGNQTGIFIDEIYKQTKEQDKGNQPQIAKFTPKWERLIGFLIGLILLIVAIML